jgi:hypothetical protein
VWRGIRLTDVGREVLARMSGRTTIPRQDILNVLERASDLAKESPATGEAENAKEGMSHLQPVKGARDRKDHDRFSELAATTRFLRIDQLRMQTEASAANAETSSLAIITPSGLPGADCRNRRCQEAGMAGANANVTEKTCSCRDRSRRQSSALTSSPSIPAPSWLISRQMNCYS